jgi:hypothetical protein
VTNSHVVWPFDKVRVVFPSGIEFIDVPVLNRDVLGDLAILGPIETDITPIELVDGENLGIGDNVYLIGYPGEVDKFPQPTITGGIISRLRQWDLTEITYFQTDATIDGGQSGGVLVSELGSVIGISNFSFSNADFGLVASASDVLPRVQSLIAGESLEGLSSRKMPFEGGKKRYFNIRLSNEWDRKIYIVNEPKNTEIKIKADSQTSNVGFVIWDPHGRDPIYIDNGFIGTETATFVTKLDAPYFIDLYQKPKGGSISLESTHNLIPFVDVDEFRNLPKYKSISGQLDYPGDIDRFNLYLKAGETVNILVDSLLIDPVLIISQAGGKEEQLLIDDNSGEGMFGVSAELTFIAPASDAYLVIIGDKPGHNTGGYSIQVRDSYDGAPTPMAPKPTATPIESEFGTMTNYSSDSASFSIQYPATWTDDITGFGEWQAVCSVAKACFAGDALLIIMEENLSLLGNLSLKEYVDFYLSAIEKNTPNIKLLSREKFTTKTMLAGEVISLDFGGLFRMKRFIYIHDGVGFNATYMFTREKEKSLLPLIDYTFSTFAINE